MRVSYTIGERTFTFRTFTQRDLGRTTGRLALLPVGGGDDAATPHIGELTAISDAILCLCSRAPKLTADESDEIPDGTFPVSELTDAEYADLLLRLSRDSGFSSEAVAAVRPTSATSEECSS